MHASNKTRKGWEAGLQTVAEPWRALVRGLWLGCLGHTVRCVPTRRTVAAVGAAGLAYGKWRWGQRRQAAVEWQWLHLLPMLGLRTPVPLALLSAGRRSLLVMQDLPGRSMDAWWLQANQQGWLAELCQYVCREVAPRVQRLHQHGLVYRDLYWFHIVAEDPRAGSVPGFLDVERVLRPRWLWRRWVCKDLAGLWATVPAGIELPRFTLLRFARLCLGVPLHERRSWLREIERRRARLLRRQPRYG
jgi:hypothetical protein